MTHPALLRAFVTIGAALAVSLLAPTSAQAQAAHKPSPAIRMADQRIPCPTDVDVNDPAVPAPTLHAYLNCLAAQMAEVHSVAAAHGFADRSFEEQQAAVMYVRRYWRTVHAAHPEANPLKTAREGAMEYFRNAGAVLPRGSLDH